MLDQLQYLLSQYGTASSQDPVPSARTQLQECGAAVSWASKTRLKFYDWTQFWQLSNRYSLFTYSCIPEPSASQRHAGGARSRAVCCARSRARWNTRTLQQHAWKQNKKTEKSECQNCIFTPIFKLLQPWRWRLPLEFAYRLPIRPPTWLVGHAACICEEWKNCDRSLRRKRKNPKIVSYSWISWSGSEAQLLPPGWRMSLQSRTWMPQWWSPGTQHRTRLTQLKDRLLRNCEGKFPLIYPHDLKGLPSSRTGALSSIASTVGRAYAVVGKGGAPTSVSTLPESGHFINNWILR